MISRFSCMSANLRFVHNNTILKLHLMPQAVSEQPPAYVLEFEPHRNHPSMTNSPYGELWKYRATVALSYFGQLQHIFCRDSFKLERKKNQKYNLPQQYLLIEKKPKSENTDIRLSGANKHMEYDYRLTLDANQLKSLQLGIKVGMPYVMGWNSLEVQRGRSQQIEEAPLEDEIIKSERELMDMIKRR